MLRSRPVGLILLSGQGSLLELLFGAHQMTMLSFVMSLIVVCFVLGGPVHI